MTWTKTPPTKPGAYWWRASSGVVKCCEVFIDRDGNRIAQGFGVSDDVDLLKGEWCGPLVPVEEVRKAYYEGHIHAISSDPDVDPQELSWPNSRARRVVEGDEKL